MEIRIHSGQWVASICQAMATGLDGDCFVLPSFAHLHAYEIAKRTTNQKKEFKVRVQL